MATTKRNYWFKWHKTFLSIVIGIIILLLLFSVIWIAVLYINNPNPGVTVQQQPVNIEDLNFEPVVETAPVPAWDVVNGEVEGEAALDALDGELIDQPEWDSETDTVVEVEPVE